MDAYMKRGMRVNIGMISLGCAKNQVDSELILGVLKDAGMNIVASPEDADAIIVNTCGFIEPAKQETLDTIREMQAYGKKLIVTGCYAQRYETELNEQIPGIDKIIPLKSYPMIDKILSETFLDKSLKFGPLSYHNRVLTTSKVSPYVKLSEGCDNRCTFCAIPLIRGSFRSRPYDEVLQECAHLVASGAKELNLISQDTTKYGCDLTIDRTSLLPQLLQDIAKLEGLAWVRILYLYPDEITSDLLDVMVGEPKIAKYFDIPIQHVAKPMLRRMARRGDRSFLETLFADIRRRMPEAILRTTVIVGFPGETEADFDELKQFLDTVRFDRLGAFAYSREEDTPAYSFADQIPEQIKDARLDTILTKQQKIARQKAKERVGSVQKTIVEHYDASSKFYYGRSYAFAPDDLDGYLVFQSPKKLTIGDVVDVVVKSTIGADWIGDARIE